MHNSVPKVAAIHDISGFGRTSLTVAIPILSSMGIQVCPLPTAVISTHTVEYTQYALKDLTDHMPAFLDHWEHIGLKFDAVYSGFMASPEQMLSVERCIRNCLEEKGLAVVDPVLGDNGILDATMTPEMVEGMKKLIRCANIITPNFTESGFLLGEPYQKDLPLDKLQDRLVRLSDMGPEIVVITGIPDMKHPGNDASVIAYERREHRFWFAPGYRYPVHYPGTGDAFASVLTGGLVQGDSLCIALERAIQFVTLGIRTTFGLGIPSRHGILLERILDSLQLPVCTQTCLLIQDCRKAGGCK
ncbi:MAG: pyridoxamine kinase [Desulfovibrionaceae bacterium]|nr:pyridoxamine kinase [Desulfovibrionaceae bacterium]